MLILTLAAIAIVALCAHAAAGTDDDSGGAVARALDSRAAVAVVFALSVLVLRLSWGSGHPLAVVQDELSYLLQAEIFARGRWTLPAQPIPAFWEQPQVLVQPAVASKYFPGHALVLAAGAAAGWPALVPLLLQGASAALLFVLARRVANGAIALLAWVIWLGTPIVLYYGPSYFSEATTTACWLAGWYALLQWRASRRLGWLLAVALLVGWTILTRPLTGVAYAIPVGVVVLRDVATGRHWRDLAAAVAVGAAVLAIVPLWSARTTGDARTTPLMLYTAQYRPYDVPGFGLVAARPALEISPQLAQLNARDHGWHAAHRPAALPAALRERWRHLAEMIWGSWHGVLLLCAVAGLVTLRGAPLFGVASSVFLLLVYLSFAAPAPWVLYYYESVPAYAYLTAAGVAWAASMAGRLRRTSRRRDWRSPRWTMPLVVGTIVLAVPGIATYRIVGGWHRDEQRRVAAWNAFRDGMASGRAVVFVRYLEAHDPNFSFVRNVADPAGERIWVVRDLGDALNARLLALVPDRSAFVFDEARNAVAPYAPATSMVSRAARP